MIVNRGRVINVRRRKREGSTTETTAAAIEKEEKLIGGQTPSKGEVFELEEMLFDEETLFSNSATSHPTSATSGESEGTSELEWKEMAAQLCDSTGDAWPWQTDDLSYDDDLLDSWFITQVLS